MQLFKEKENPILASSCCFFNSIWYQDYMGGFVLRLDSSDNGLGWAYGGSKYDSV